MMGRIMTIVINDQDNHLVHLCIFLEAFFMTLDQVRHPFLKFQEEIEQGLWTWHKIEGDRKCSSLLKVGKPQFGPCKLPLHVSIILYNRHNCSAWKQNYRVLITVWLDRRGNGYK